MGSRILFAMFFFVSLSSSAEYRAFLLKISGPAPAPPIATTTEAAVTQVTSAPTEGATTKDPDFRLVKSNLSAEQYPTYYPLKAGETIVDADTWMCRDRTGDFREICDNPKNPRVPAAEATAPPVSEAATAPATPQTATDPTPPKP